MYTKWSHKIGFFLSALILCSGFVFAKSNSDDGVWKPVDKTQLRQPGIDSPGVPSAYETFRLNKSALLRILNNAPEEFSGGENITLSLPMPDGSYSRFRIEHSLVVEPGLLVNYPELGATYRAHGIDDPTATARFDFLPSGFHSMILSINGTVIVDPYMKGDTDNYMSYYKHDRMFTGEFKCHFGEGTVDSIFKPTKFGPSDFLPDSSVPEVTSGSQLRTYKLALAGDFEYCAAVGGGTLTGCLAAEVLIMNRVNGVYERDVAIHMNIIASNNLITYAGNNLICPALPVPTACTAANDPYSNTSPNTLLSQNQANLDTVIGDVNYDIGHVFTTGGGGLATLNVPCAAGSKARAETGLGNPVGDDFAIDFVAHEMGHQFGALHTFNGSGGNCSGGNRSASAAYEPGSGITIMAYAGICAASDLAPHSIDTFHVKSLEQIVAFREGGGVCGPATATGNTPPTVSVVGGPTFNIPKQTPFTLTATGSDVNGDTLSYDWEEYDLGPVSPPDTDSDGQRRPLFRPFLPLASPSRTYPTLTYILNNANVPPATTGGFVTGEILPSIARTMTFQVVARDNRANGGGINTATATVVVDGNGPFAVLSPNTVTTWNAGTQTVTWNVASTNASPVNAANVKISLSTDGGNTFPTVLSASTPNDGSEAVTSPAINSSLARIKVEAIGNIFFDISDVNFNLSSAAATSGVISGRILRASGRGVGRVRVTITGGTPAINITTISNSFGFYSFAGIPFGASYTITPQPFNGMTFSPLNIVQNHTADALNLDFTAQ